MRATKEALGKRPSAVGQAHGPERSRSAALPSSLVTSVYFYVRLIPRDLSALRLDSPPCGWVPSFVPQQILRDGHFLSASQMLVFRESQRSY